MTTNTTEQHDPIASNQTNSGEYADYKRQLINNILAETGHILGHVLRKQGLKGFPNMDTYEYMLDTIEVLADKAYEDVDVGDLHRYPDETGKARRMCKLHISQHLCRLLERHMRSRPFPYQRCARRGGISVNFW